MTLEQYYKNLSVPAGAVDVVLDTDAYNEIDDQFAICYLLKSEYKLRVKGICAAPFLNKRSESAADGMRKSYEEILRLLKLAGREELTEIVHSGSESYLPDETTPVKSEAAEFMAKLADRYSPENPLYIIAIGAITNVASAFLLNPNMKENCVVVWLGGHAPHIPLPVSEFNMRQDIAAARVVLGCGVPVVQLPCKGVVDRFSTNKYELIHWLQGKNPLCDYLCENTIRFAENKIKLGTWSKPIWDVVAVAWLLNEDSVFMKDRLVPSPLPEYDKHYARDDFRHLICRVYEVNRDALFADLFRVLGEEK